MAIDWSAVEKRVPKAAVPLLDAIKTAYASAANDSVVASRDVDKLLRERIATIRLRYESAKKDARP